MANMCGSNIEKNVGKEKNVGPGSRIGRVLCVILFQGQWGSNKNVVSDMIFVL